MLRSSAIAEALKIAEIAVANSTKNDPCKEQAECLADFIEVLADRLEKINIADS